MPYFPIDLTNTAATTVGSTLSATGTSLTLATGGGAILTAAGIAPFYILLGASNNLAELALVTAMSTDTATLASPRGQFGIHPAQAWPSGTTVQRVGPVSADILFQAMTVILSVANAASTNLAALNGGTKGLLTLTGNTAQTLAVSGTITTAGLSVSRVNPSAANATSVVLQAGTVDGQVIVVENTHATHTVTFAASGTSGVSDGTSDVIAALTARAYVWDATGTLWYPVV